IRDLIVTGVQTCALPISKNRKLAVDNPSSGALVASRPPAWLRVEGRRFVIIEERAAVVRNIFTLAASGIGASSIVRRLNREGVRSEERRVGKACRCWWGG